MSKTNKISEEQLKNLQETVGLIQNGQAQLGGIELQKHKMLHEIAGIEVKLAELQKELEEEFGKVSINIKDGTYEEIVEEAEVEEV